MNHLMTRLWREVFGEPPPLADDSHLLTQILVENLPPAPPYQPSDFRVLGRRAEAAAPQGSVEEEQEVLRA
jgi:hypothetical protein